MWINEWYQKKQFQWFVDSPENLESLAMENKYKLYFSNALSPIKNYPACKETGKYDP